MTLPENRTERPQYLALNRFNSTSGRGFNPAATKVSRSACANLSLLSMRRTVTAGFARSELYVQLEVQS